MKSGEIPAIDAAFTLIDGRTDFSVRIAVAAGDSAEAARRLEAASAVSVPPYPRLALVLSEPRSGDFAGATRLYGGFAAFRAAADRFGALAQDRFEFDPTVPFRETSHAPTGRLNRALVHFAFAYATNELLMSLGVKPQAVVGQGALDLMAACLAGITSEETALAMVADRFRLGGGSSSTMSDRFKAAQPRRAQICYLGYGSSDFADPDDVATPEFWLHGPDNVRAWQVNARAIANWGATVAVDIGAGGLPATDTGEDGAPGPTLFSISPHGGSDDEHRLFDLLASLWSHGVADDGPAAVLASADPNRRAHKASLPTYSFARERHWVDVEPRSVDDASGVPMDVATKTTETQWLVSPVWTEAVGVGAHAQDAISAAVIGGDPGGLGGALSEQLSAPHFPGGPDAALRLAGQVAQSPPGAAIWCMWPEHAADPADPPRTALDKAISCRDGLAAMCREIATAGWPRRLIVVTQGLARVRNDEWVAPEFALILGPLRSQPHETPLLSCQVVDVEASLNDGVTAAQLAGLVEATRPDSTPVEFTAVRGGRLWTRELRHVGFVPDETELPRQGRFIVIGGDQRMGRALASALAAKSDGATIGLLVQPSPDLAADRATFATELMTKFGARVVTVEANIATSEAAVDMQDLAARLGGVDGVIHAASGCVDDTGGKALEGSSPGSVGPNVWAVPAIEEAFRDMPLEFLALCSTAEAQWGAPARSDAIGAHAFLDHFAASPRLPLCRRKLSIGWDHWRDPTTTLDEGFVSAEPRSDVLNHGLTELQGRQWFLRCLATSLQAPIVSMVAPAYFSRRLRQRADEAVKRYAAQSDVRVGRDDGRLGKPRPELESAYQAPDKPMERLLAMLWSENLGYGKIGIHDRFIELGGDETAAFGLLWQIHRCTGFDIPMDVFYNLQTIEKCSEYLWQMELDELRKLRLEVEEAVGKEIS